jgi:mitochondrial import inner membrane translocase subunit TIM17
MAGMISAIKQRAPVIGGNFAVWASMFSFFDCMCIFYRQKEDPINSITAGALTGGVLAARGGTGAIIRGGIVGGIILAMIEGIGITMNRMFTESQLVQQQQMQASQTANAPQQ